MRGACKSRRRKPRVEGKYADCLNGPGSENKHYLKNGRGTQQEEV